ncbi:hypothetical protein M3650_25955 [Paenibacillus sp. MER TA 81-3]|nr:hypothetical protein [Paenibacillus sp. MER TA 81-3]
MQHTFFDMLSEQNEKGTTIFFSTHVLSEVEKLCQRVAFISEGKLLRVCDVDSIPRQGRTHRVCPLPTAWGLYGQIPAAKPRSRCRI